MNWVSHKSVFELLRIFLKDYSLIAVDDVKRAAIPGIGQLVRVREAVEDVCEQLGELRERLEAKDRAVDFGIEVMGRVRDLGSLDDIVAIAPLLSRSRAGNRRRTARDENRRRVERLGVAIRQYGAGH